MKQMFCNIRTTNKNNKNFMRLLKYLRNNQGNEEEIDSSH